MAISTDRSPRVNRSLRQFAADLPVGRKLATGFAAMGVVLFVLVSGLFVTVARLGGAHESVTGQAAARAQGAERLRFAAANLRGAQQAYVLDNGTSRGQFAEASRDFEGALDALRVSVVEPVDRALVAKVTTGYQTFVVTDQLVWEALQRGEPVLARNLTLGAEGLAFGFMAEDAAMLADRAAVQQGVAEHRFDHASRDAQFIGVVLAAAALALVIGASRAITRLIRDPLQCVQQGAELAADGDLDAQVNVFSDDETGRLARAFNTMLERLRHREHALLVDHRRQELAGQVHRALEIADDESAVLDVVGRSLSTITRNKRAELLLADNSKAHLTQAVVSGPDPRGPGCLVESPFSCPAVRNGTAMSFPSSSALDACPHLQGRSFGTCSAVCVPVTFMGRAIGVLHTVDEDGVVPPDDQEDALTMLSTQAGARIGMLRSMQKTQTQATTDALTGLMNRRSFETRIRALHRNGVNFTLVMADLDHFKMVNDTHGHEAGDRALRAFAEVAKATIRTDDLVARWGGEEFSLALMDIAPDEAKEILDRMRLELAARLSNGDFQPFTASFGLADAGACATLESAVRLADAALYRAKDEGRDRAVVAESPVDSAASTLRAPTRSNILAAIARDDDPLDY